ncbi:unnamed protein product [Fraxinus pennsylvanica]|uniref:Amino acid transporter transmembrane domain-containing protein n=1 Tax=Fraxinus pennsylvanica TaxID=56036 RepID=A0AAD1YTC0_9LAMI|nr:unnamed protein product [Fraxinus pennsylvanica]
MVEVEERDGHTSPLLTDSVSSSANSHNNSIKRTGTVWTAIAHIITGVIGYPDPEVGHIRNRSYAEAVRSYLGKKSMWVAGSFLQESYFGYGIAYTITSAISMRAILKSNCYHKEGHNAPFAAIMSFAYTFIGLALGFAKVVENGEIKGDITGVSTATTVQKVWLSSQAIGDIAFAFTYNVILLDIQDTLKAPPPENKTMKKASATAILITTIFFLCCGCFGYAAFGSQAPGNLLTGFGFYEPYWLVDFANACIVLHLVGGYQIYSQPLFAVAERWISNKHPDIEMYLAQNNVRAWTGTWTLLQAFKIFCLLCTILALVGSLEGLISNKLS